MSHIIEVGGMAQQSKGQQNLKYFHKLSINFRLPTRLCSWIMGSQRKNSNIRVQHITIRLVLLDGNYSRRYIGLHFISGFSFQGTTREDRGLLWGADMKGNSCSVGTEMDRVINV